MKNNEIVRALRCISTAGGENACEHCPYWRKQEIPEEEQPVYGTATWHSCDIDRVGLDGADLIERLTARCARYAEEIAVLQEKTRWIPVTERLPEPETDVLAVCNRNGNIFVVPAIYENGKMLTQDSKWNWCDIDSYGLYSEEADDYFVPEGWWENRQFNPDDVYNNLIDCAVTHWMPLPEAPEEER